MSNHAGDVCFLFVALPVASQGSTDPPCTDASLNPSWTLSGWSSNFSDPDNADSLNFRLRNNANQYTMLCFSRGSVLARACEQMCRRLSLAEMFRAVWKYLIVRGQVRVMGLVAKLISRRVRKSRLQGRDGQRRLSEANQVVKLEWRHRQKPRRNGRASYKLVPLARHGFSWVLVRKKLISFVQQLSGNPISKPDSITKRQCYLIHVPSLIARLYNLPT